MTATLFLPEGMHHVSRRELYTSLRARLHYLHSFLEFGKADVEALQKAQPFVKSLIPHVAELVYNKLLQQDITAQALVTQNTTKECELDEDDFYGKDSKNVRIRHMFVRWYLTRMNSDPTSEKYWEYVNQVGAMHNGHHRRQPLHVDVIHFSLMLGHVQNILTDAILTSPSIPAHQKAPLIKAWGKLFWIQNDLFTKWHVRDGDMYDQTTPEATKLNPESVQNSDNVMMADDEGRPAQCPFAGVAVVRESIKGDEVKIGYVYREGRPRAKTVGIGSIESISSPESIQFPFDLPFVPRVCSPRSAYSG